MELRLCAFAWQPRVYCNNHGNSSFCSPGFSHSNDPDPMLTLAQENEDADELQKMKDDVMRSVMDQQMDPLAKLELIDAIQRLGLEYHFEIHIKHGLDSIREYFNSNGCRDGCDNLSAVAPRFRLLRQQGFYEMPRGKYYDMTGLKVFFLNLY